MTNLRFKRAHLNIASWFENVEYRGLDKLFGKWASEGLRNTFRDFPPSIDFEADGKQIIVGLNLGNTLCDDGMIYMTADINDMIKEYIETTHRDNMEGGDDAKRALAVTLRAAAEKLEKEAAKAD